MPPLNPQLHSALERTYRHVEIVNHGAPARVVHKPEWFKGKVRLKVKVEGGEYYKINCPFCNDTRMRCVFNHLYGEQDEKTGQLMIHLVHCFNEDCIDDRETQEFLYDKLFAIGPRRAARTRSAPVAPTIPAAPAPAAAARLPSRRIKLPQLPEGHHALEYLVNRDFDPDEIWRRWQVSYCEKDTEAKPKLINRLVIPIFHIKTTLGSGTVAERKVLVGWQARALRGTRKGVPKYLTMKGMTKSRLLYGLPQAVRTTGPVIVVEGPTDVWRLGTNAVALFGKSMSRSQRALLLRHFPGRPVVFFLDSDAQMEVQRGVAMVHHGRLEAKDLSPVVAASLPAGRNDVGECHRDEAWDRIASALNASTDALGVEVRELLCG